MGGYQVAGSGTPSTQPRMVLCVVGLESTPLGKHLFQLTGMQIRMESSRIRDLWINLCGETV
jgi:hypothetical protein